MTITGFVALLDQHNFKPFAVMSDTQPNTFRLYYNFCQYHTVLVTTDEWESAICDNLPGFVLVDAHETSSPGFWVFTVTSTGAAHDN